MSKALASFLALTLSLGNVASSVGAAAPIKSQKPVLETSGAKIESVHYRHYHHHYRHRRYAHHRHYRHGGAAAAAMFGAVVGGILSNPCLGHYRVCSPSHKDWWLTLFRAPHGRRLTSSRGQDLSEVRV